MNAERTEVKFIGDRVVEKFFGEEDDMDGESSKRHYCASWVHVGCGGAPDAYVGILLGCTACDETWDGSGPLGEAIVRTEEFVSLCLPK